MCESASARIRERDELAKLPLFEDVPRGDLDALLAGLESARFKAGEVIVAERDGGDALYIIAEGTVAVTQNGRQVRDLSAGDYFGEVALLTAGLRTATVTAKSEARAYSLSREGFERMVATAGKRTILAGMESYADLANQS